MNLIMVPIPVAPMTSNITPASTVQISRLSRPYLAMMP